MKKKSSSQASWSILSEGVSASRVEAHIVRSHVNQMVEAIKEHPQLAEEVYKRCGDNFEAIPKHLSKMERSLDRTNYALITMGSDWYRQRLTHEDREMVDMAAKYNPTPFPSTSKQSEYIMKKHSSNIKNLLIEAIEKHEPMIYIYDPEFRDEMSEKYTALWSGDFEEAISLTRDRRVKKVLNRIIKDMEIAGMRRSASEIINSLESRVARLENKTARINTTYTLTHKLMDDRDIIATWEDKGQLRGEDIEEAVKSEFGEIEGLMSVEVKPSSIVLEQDSSSVYAGYAWGVEDHFTEAVLNESGHLETTLTFRGLSKKELNFIAHLLERENLDFRAPY